MLIRRFLSILAFVAAFFVAAEAFADPVYQSQTLACTHAATPALSASGGTQAVASITGKQIYVCGFLFWTNATASAGVQLEYAAAGSCAAGPYTAITPPMNFGATSGFIDHQSYYEGLLPVPSGNDLCLVETAGTIVSIVYYTQF